MTKRNNHSWPKRTPLYAFKGIGKGRLFRCFKCGAQRFVTRDSYVSIPRTFFRFRADTPFKQVKRLPECNPVALQFWCEELPARRELPHFDGVPHIHGITMTGN